MRLSERGRLQYRAQATATHAINRLAAVVAEAPTKANNARGDTRRMRDARRWGTNVGTLA